MDREKAVKTVRDLLEALGDLMREGFKDIFHGEKKREVFALVK